MKRKLIIGVLLLAMAAVAQTSTTLSLQQLPIAIGTIGPAFIMCNVAASILPGSKPIPCYGVVIPGVTVTWVGTVPTVTLPASVAINFADQETPGGAVDGTNVAFTLAHPPNPAAGLLFARNGMLQKAGSDYTLAGNVMTFINGVVPTVGDTLLAWYRY
jgi:hypothetical protein